MILVKAVKAVKVLDNTH